MPDSEPLTGTVDTDALRQAGRKLNDALAQTGFNLRAMGVLGQIRRGEVEAARETLAALPDDIVESLRDGAETLAAMAKERLSE